MARVVVELTNRCNLRCRHCYDQRHAGTAELSLDVIDRLLNEGKQCGIQHLSFTGGEATLHSEFVEIIGRVCGAGYDFSLVSNGSSFPEIYPLFLKYREWFKGVTFSLDGARQQTHDGLRGKGSFREVMGAASVCVYNDLPFTLNMVVTRQNRNQIQEMADLGRSLGSRGVRFGFLMPTADTARRGLDLSPEECRETELEIRKVKKDSPLSIGMGPGYYSDSPFFPCGPLELEEFNVDCDGNLTLCCQLSGYSGPKPGTDLIGNLRTMNLTEALVRFRGRVDVYLADKRDSIRDGEFDDLDYFPCWYCVKYLGKIEMLKQIPSHPWIRGEAASQRKT
jgi:MoaA/NifB/PqqE/SkfB family radical SAM enzyme